MGGGGNPGLLYVNYTLLPARACKTNCNSDLFSYTDLEEFGSDYSRSHCWEALMDRYEKIDAVLLGSGTFGDVFKARDKETNEIVALKRIKHVDHETNGIPPTTLREISLLRELSDSPDIVTLLSVVVEPGADRSKYYLVFEFVENDLAKVIAENDLLSSVAKVIAEARAEAHPLPPMLVKSYMQQLLRGMVHCHSRGFLHRDLKPHNLLVDVAGKLKIADFGLGRAFSSPIRQLTHEVVTLWYRAPEVLLAGHGGYYGPPLDIWSAGGILFEMVTRSPLFPGRCEIDQIFRTFRVLGTPTEALWPGVSALQDFSSSFPQFRAKGLAVMVREHGGADTADKFSWSCGLDLLAQCLQYSPGERITARQALCHPYFDDRARTCPFDELGFGLEQYFDEDGLPWDAQLTPPPNKLTLSQHQQAELYSLLKGWRQGVVDASHEARLPEATVKPTSLLPWNVWNNSGLVEITKVLPRSLIELSGINGVGKDERWQKYGKDVLGVINKYLEDNGLTQAADGVQKQQQQQQQQQQQ
jgi:serine/threonine protein kinase